MTSLRFFSLLLLSALAADSFSQTTMEEYNYLVKGYKIQIETGLDKAGYHFKDLVIMDIDKDTQAEFKALYRDNDSVPCAVMVIYTYLPEKEKKVDYLCIPHAGSDDEIWDMANAQLARYPLKVLQLFTSAVLRYSAPAGKLKG